jgi:hypothetical protein
MITEIALAVEMDADAIDIDIGNARVTGGYPGG